MRGRGCLAVLMLMPMQPGLAQRPASPAPSFLDSVAADVARHLRVLAADSMWARATPSPELERTAQYVAAQFRTLGLRPTVSNQGNLVLSRPSPSQEQYGWMQRYPIPGQRPVDYTRSRVNLLVNGLSDARGSTVLSEAGQPMMRMTGISLATEARLASGGWGSLSTWGDGGDQAVLVAGRHTAESLRKTSVRSRPVFYMPSAGESVAARLAVIEYLVTVCEGVLVVDDADSASFAAALRTANQQRRPFLDNYLKAALGAPGWVVHIRRETAEAWLASAGIDLARIGADTTPVIRPVQGAFIGLTVQADSATPEVVTAPNAIGLLEGTDSSLKHEYVVISAPLDVRGAGPATAGRAGLPTLLAIAQAFSRPGARPRRSLLFAATSGTTPSGWGSSFLASTLPSPQAKAKIVANLHLDMDPRAAGDTVTVDGATDVDFPVPLAWVATEHPELAVIVGATMLDSLAQTASVVFVRRGIPALVFHLPPGRGDAGGERATTVASGAALPARAAGLVFYISRTLAMTAERPRRTAEARRRYLQLFPSSP